MKEVLARFPDARSLAAAIRDLRARGYSKLDAATPYGSREVEAALAARHSRIPWIAGAVAACAGFGAWLILWWTNAHDYRIDVGGRPMHSFWSDVPIIFETMILTSGITAFIGFFAASGLPRLHHPWFDVADVDEGFWLAVDTRDPEHSEALEHVLRDRGAMVIEEVER
jgi:hypothetical protein